MLQSEPPSDAATEADAERAAFLAATQGFAFDAPVVVVRLWRANICSLRIVTSAPALCICAAYCVSSSQHGIRVHAAHKVSCRLTGSTG